jgi:hypothetical protein
MAGLVRKVCHNDASSAGSFVLLVMSYEGNSYCSILYVHTMIYIHLRKSHKRGKVIIHKQSFNLFSCYDTKYPEICMYTYLRIFFRILAPGRFKQTKNFLTVCSKESLNEWTVVGTKVVTIHESRRIKPLACSRILTTCKIIFIFMTKITAAIS